MDIERRLDELKIQKSFRRWYGILKDDGFNLGRVSWIRMSKGFRTLGECTLKQGGNFEIAISRASCAAGEDVLSGTICHELIHTMPGCFDHGPQFLANARRIKERYGVDVEKGTPKTHAAKVRQTAFYKPHRVSYNYRITCCKCGVEAYAKRQGRTLFNIINGSDAYTCKKCGGRRFSIDRLEKF